MAPATGTALLVLVAFVLPGFVAVLIGERTHEVPVRNRSPFELLLLTGYYSVLTYGLVALVTWPFGLSRGTLRDWYREESWAGSARSAWLRSSSSRRCSQPAHGSGCARACGRGSSGA